MSNPEHDEMFEAYLSRRSVLPDAVEANLVPPATLDDTVLKLAREAIEAGVLQNSVTTAQPVYRAPRWAIPVALAAVLLLCLSVALNISLNMNRPEANAQQATASRNSVSGDIPSHEVILPGARLAKSREPSPPPVAEQMSAPRPGAMASSAKPASAETAVPHPADPDLWLQQIYALRAAGETQQADAELRRFRAAFPAHSTNPAASPSTEPRK